MRFGHRQYSHVPVEEAVKASETREQNVKYCHCGSIAHYKVGLRGFCTKHRDEAEGRCKKYGVPRIESISAYIEAKEIRIDKALKHKQRAKQSVRFGGK